jgi:hypothetical protein
MKFAPGEVAQSETGVDRAFVVGLHEGAVGEEVLKLKVASPPIATACWLRKRSSALRNTSKDFAPLPMKQQ